jgi:hypothetical protein
MPRIPYAKPEDMTPETRAAVEKPVREARMRAQWLCCLAAMVMLTGTRASAAEPGNGVQLACGDMDRKSEAKLLGQAPSGAKRLAKHVLQVKVAHGAVNFADKPPYDADLDGIRYYYCGYDAGTHTHLIGEADNGVFTGKLLRDDDGKAIDGGKDVLIAPDRKKFLATAQPDGQDGETWSVRDFNGTEIWGGYAGILVPGKDGDRIYAEFSNPRWNAESQLIADASCLDSDKVDGQVSLGTTDSGLKWSPMPTCEKGPK